MAKSKLRQPPENVRVREPGLDITRTMAVFLVLSVHFFLYNGFYSQPQSDSGMILHTSFRYFTYACVPLFCVISGYLLNKKTLSRGYYKGIIKILYVYLLSGTVDTLFKVFYLHQEIDFGGYLKSLLDFSAAPYAWYINMYIGLFLLIPFINLIYNNLGTQRKKLVLIGTLVFITCLPGLLNGAGTVPGYLFGINFPVLPTYWVSIYPITYYFIGAYICEFKPKPKKLLVIAGIIITSLMEGLIVRFQSGSNNFTTTLDGYNSFFTAIVAVLIFLLLYNINPKNKLVTGIFKSTSNAALGIYLTSYMFDNIFYAKLNTSVAAISDRYKYYFIIVPLNFICSFVVSALINLTYKLIMMAVGKMRRPKQDPPKGRAKPRAKSKVQRSTPDYESIYRDLSSENYNGD